MTAPRRVCPRGPDSQQLDIEFDVGEFGHRTNPAMILPSDMERGLSNFLIESGAWLY